MKSQKKRMPGKKPKQQRHKMSKDYITISSGTTADSLTVSDTVTLDMGAAQPALTASGCGISLDDIISTTITLPSSGLGGDSGAYYNSFNNMGTYTINTSGYTTSNPVTVNTNGISMSPGTDITIGGKSLMESIEKIEERLCILKPNPELEVRWEQLKKLREQYIEMEKDLLEKEKIMKILKES